MKVTVLEICNDSDSTLICTNSEVCRGIVDPIFIFENSICSLGFYGV